MDVEARLSPQFTALHLAIGLFVSDEATVARSGGEGGGPVPGGIPARTGQAADCDPLRRRGIGGGFAGRSLASSDSMRGRAPVGGRINRAAIATSAFHSCGSLDAVDSECCHSGAEQIPRVPSYKPAFGAASAVNGGGRQGGGAAQP